MKLHDVLESTHARTGQVLIKSPIDGRFRTTGQNAKYPTAANPQVASASGDAQKEAAKAQKKYEQMLKKRAKKDLRFNDFGQWSEEVKRRYLGRTTAMHDNRGNVYAVHPNDSKTMFAKWSKGDKVGFVWAKGRYNNMQLEPIK